MGALDSFLKKLGITEAEAKQLENAAAPKFKWKFGHPIEILEALERTLPPDWVDYEPETLRKAIAGKFGDEYKKDENKIFALQVAVTTDRTWNDWDVFENTCLAFMGQVPIWGVIEPLDLHEIAFGMGCLERIRKEEKYSEDVLGYIAATYAYNGLITQPTVGPDVSEIIRRITSIDSSIVRRYWDSGLRSDNVNDTPSDPIEAQLQKLEIVEDWYKLGRDYE